MTLKLIIMTNSHNIRVNVWEISTDRVLVHLTRSVEQNLHRVTVVYRSGSGSAVPYGLAVEPGRDKCVLAWFGSVTQPHSAGVFR